MDKAERLRLRAEFHLATNQAEEMKARLIEAERAHIEARTRVLNLIDKLLPLWQEGDEK